MAYRAGSMALARAASRWNFTRGNILPPGYTPPPVTETSSETMAAIARSLGTTPGPIPSAIPRKPSPTEFRGQHRTYTHHVLAPLGIGNSGAMTTELFSLPGIVRRILITTDAVTANEIELLVTTSQNVNPTDAELLGAPAIFPNPSSGLGTAGVYVVASGAPFAVPLDHIVQTIPFRLASWIRNTTAGPHRAMLHITMQDLDPEDLRVISVPVILQQQVLTRSLTSPAPPAPQGQAPPRGLRMKVFAENRLLYSRDIPWIVVDPVIKVEFMTALFNNAVPNTMEPIW